MILEIPLSKQEGHYTETVELQGVDYILAFDWNSRAEAWFFTIRTSDGVDLLSGVRLCLGTFIGGQSVDERMPPGVFMLMDTSITGAVEPTLETLGQSVKLLYLEN